MCFEVHFQECAVDCFNFCFSDIYNVYSLHLRKKHFIKKSLINIFIHSGFYFKI